MKSVPPKCEKFVGLGKLGLDILKENDKIGTMRKMEKAILLEKVKDLCIL